MKRNFLSLLLLAVAGAAFTSCDDHIADEAAVNSTPTNYFTLSGSTRNTTTTGILQYNTKAEKNAASGETYYRHEIGFLSNDFAIGYDQTEGLIITGEGSSVWFNINSKTSTLEPGTYTFTGVDESSKAFDFSYGAANVLDENYNFTSGQIVVSKTGSDYTISFEGDVVAQGTTTSTLVKGNFSGKLNTYEDK